MDALQKDLRRFVEEYGWDWTLTCKCLNRRYDANLTPREVQDLYWELTAPAESVQDAPSSPESPSLPLSSEASDASDGSRKAKKR